MKQFVCKANTFMQILLSFHFILRLVSFDSSNWHFFRGGEGGDSPTHPTITRTTLAHEAERYPQEQNFLTSLSGSLPPMCGESTRPTVTWQFQDSPDQLFQNS